MKPNFLKLLLLLVFAGFIFESLAQNPVKLPDAQKTGGMPLMEALSKRKTTREFSPVRLDLQVLSNLLWAANGINREETNRKTAPSAVNWQEIDIYVCLEEAVYVYNAKNHSLDFYMQGDLRAATGRQEFVKHAPVNLVFVADFSRMGDRADDVKHWYSAADAAFISQNVYLFCASEGLGTVVRGAVDKESLKVALNLPPHKHVVLAQTVGYPKEQ